MTGQISARCRSATSFQPASNLSATSFEPDSVMEFGLYQGLKPVSGYATAWSLHPQTYGYLPSRSTSLPSDRYQIIGLLLGDKGIRVGTTHAAVWIPTSITSSQWWLLIRP